VNFEQRKSGVLAPRYFRARDRFAPPTKMGARVEGRIHYQLIGRDGKVKQEGEMHNLVLDQGLDYVASFGLSIPVFAYCAVGTGSTAPAVTDTGLVAEISRVNTTYQGDSRNMVSNGVYDVTRYFEFTYGAANGNLTEFGMSPNSAAGTNLFSRALFVDGGGTPTPITKTSAEKLRIAYTLTVTLTPTVMTAGSFTITNIGAINGNYTLISGVPAGDAAYGWRPDLDVVSYLITSGPNGGVTSSYAYLKSGGLKAMDADQSALVYTSAVGEQGGPNIARAVTAHDAYVPGSYQRTGGLWTFDTPYANITHQGYVIGAAYHEGLTDRMVCGYVFDIDTASIFTKDNLHNLTIGVPTLTWSR